MSHIQRLLAAIAPFLSALSIIPSLSDDDTVTIRVTRQEYEALRRAAGVRVTGEDAP